MITDRDREIINFIEDIGFITIEQCGKLFYTESKVGYDLARRRLKKIVNQGLYIKQIKNIETKQVLYVPKDSKIKRVSKHDLLVIDYLSELKFLGAEIENVEIEKDFKWLTDEIKEKNKGNRSFVIGWFNIKNRKFGDIMQIGTKAGQNPLINKERISLFPFLNYNPKTCKTSDVTYRYGEAFKELNISIAGVEEHVSCMFLGKETDLFHFAIYW